jgi:hypothetical protein
MNQPITLGVDFGATSIKFGVVQVGRIIRHGNVVPTRQDGQIEPLIRSIVAEIFRLRECRGLSTQSAGTVVNLTNVKGWCGVPLAALVSGQIGLDTNLVTQSGSYRHRRRGGQMWRASLSTHLENHQEPLRANLLGKAYDSTGSARQ